MTNETIETLLTLVAVLGSTFAYLEKRNKKYDNDILNGIYEKYKFAEKIFTYFFTTEMTTKQRWDFIEAYFLGEKEDKLLNFV